MMRLALLLLPLLAACATLRGGDAENPARFVPGDRWMVLGDSITEYGMAQMWVTYFYAARLPEVHLTAWNGGIGGNTAAQALPRMGWDVAARHPSVATVMFGMNDVAIPLYRLDSGATPQSKAARLASFRTGMEGVIAKLREMPSRIVLLTPTPYEQSEAVTSENVPDVNEALGLFARAVREIGAADGLPVIDLYQGMNALDDELKEEAPEASLIRADRMHPTDLGQLAMAVLLLEGQGVAGRGQEIAVDAAALSDASRDASVEGLARRGDGVEFTATLSRLPLQVSLPGAPPRFLYALRRRLGEDRLRVTGLAEGSYDVFLDQKPCGAFSAKALADGVNLADLAPLPALAQSRKLLDLAREKMGKEGLLRLVAWLEYCIYPEGLPDSVTPDALLASLREKRAASSPALQRAIDAKIDRYAETKARQQALRDEVDALSAQIAAFPATSSVEVSIRPARSSK